MNKVSELLDAKLTQGKDQPTALKEAFVETDNALKKDRQIDAVRPLAARPEPCRRPASHCCGAVQTSWPTLSVSPLTAAQRSPSAPRAIVARSSLAQVGIPAADQRPSAAQRPPSAHSVPAQRPPSAHSVPSAVDFSRHPTPRRSSAAPRRSSCSTSSLRLARGDSGRHARATHGR